jgi:hypothetical protein
MPLMPEGVEHPLATDLAGTPPVNLSLMPQGVPYQISDLVGTPPVGSAEFWRRPYRTPITGDPDTDTALIVADMCGHVRGAAADELVQAFAQGAFHQFGGLASISAWSGVAESRAARRAIAESAWWWCKSYIRFVHHENILRRRLGEAGHLQGLIAPEILVRMDRPEGDCAIFSECLAAFLRVHGIPYEFVTVAVNPEEPDEYSHVFVYAILEDGRRLPLDASHGTQPGWQVPSRDVFRRQVWDADGAPVPDRGSRFDGLHNYGLRSGLGDTGDFGGEFTPDATTTTTLNYPGMPTGTPSDSTWQELPAEIAVPQQNTAAWANLAAVLAKGGFTLAQLQAIPPGTVINPSGQIIRQSPGYAVPVGAGTQIQSPFGSASFGSMLPWLLLIGGGVLLMSMGRR